MWLNSTRAPYAVKYSEVLFPSEDAITSKIHLARELAKCVLSSNDILCLGSFCRLCVERVPTNADGVMSCPICRASFVSTDLKRDRALERDLATITTTCTICGAKVCYYG